MNLPVFTLHPLALAFLLQYANLPSSPYHFRRFLTNLNISRITQTYNLHHRLGIRICRTLSYFSFLILSLLLLNACITCSSCSSVRLRYAVKDLGDRLVVNDNEETGYLTSSSVFLTIIRLVEVVQSESNSALTYKNLVMRRI